MALSRNLGQYADVQEVFDLTIANNGGIYEVPSDKAAIRWRQRAYMFRKLLREDMEARRDKFGFGVVTPYDKIYIQLDGNKVILTIQSMTGEFRSLHGDSILPPQPRPSDSLEDEAARLVRELGVEK